MPIAVRQTQPPDSPSAPARLPGGSGGSSWRAAFGGLPLYPLSILHLGFGFLGAAGNGTLLLEPDCQVLRQLLRMIPIFS